MWRLTLQAVCLAGALAVPVAPHLVVAARAAAPAHGSVLTLTIQSRSLRSGRRCIIYLPPNYSAAGNRGRRYPVLYLLSGSPGSQKDWFHHGKAAATADSLIDAGKVQPLILVSPDGNGGAKRDSQFLDSADGRQPVEQFLTRDLLTYVDGHFRTIRTARARGIIGFSAGAYGALNVGLHHPELFGTLAGVEGYYTADPREVTTPRINHPMSTNTAFLRRNSPSVTIGRVLPAMRPYIFLFDSTIDAPYTGKTRAFDLQLRALGVPHTTRFYAPTTAAERTIWPHSWLLARIAFHDYLVAIARHL